MEYTKKMPNSFLQEQFDIEIANFKNDVENLSVGNYTKSYETYKRISNIIRYFKKEIENKKGIMKIVDIGCGNGYYIFMLNLLLKLKDKAHFYGVDISQTEVQFAKASKKSLGMDNVTFDVCDAENIILPDESFDIVICCELIEHLAHPENCLEGIKRILKPGGAAIITTPNKYNPILRFSHMFNFLVKYKEKDFSHKIKEDSRLGAEHISVKGLNEWIKIVKAVGFKVEGIRRGSLIAGGHRYNAHPVICSAILILDRILDCLPFTHNITENITFKLRKPKV